MKKSVRESTQEPVPEPVSERTLERFRSAHEKFYDAAQSHWTWYIFPQIQGWGRSDTARYYAIQDREAAVAYWNDPVLFNHLQEISRELLKLNSFIDRIMGYPDNLKLRSCMTLFWLVTGEQLFKNVLDKFYNGKLDEYIRLKLS